MEASHTISTPSPATQPKGFPRIIALMNQKGGVGKTTTAVNLSAAAASLGQRVLLIDMDPQAHATLHLGIDPQDLERSIYTELLDSDADPAEILCQIEDNLCLLPAETDLAAAETELSNAPNRHHRLSRILNRLTDRFDLIMIDCPPSLGLLTINALACAREVLIPMQAHFLALQGVSKLFETVSLLTAQINPSLEILGVILCMHDSQATHTQEVVADLEAFFESQRNTGTPWQHAQVFRPHVRRNIKLAESPSFGQSIFTYCPDAAGAKDYRALAETLFANDGAAAQHKDDPSPAPQPIVKVVATPSDVPQGSGTSTTQHAPESI